MSRTWYQALAKYRKERIQAENEKLERDDILHRQLDILQVKLLERRLSQELRGEDQDDITRRPR